MCIITEQITSLIEKQWPVDAIYLYGSRTKNLTHANSDWDVAVLFSQWEHNKLEALLRPQTLEAELQRELNLYDQLSIVDVEHVPVPLQANIVKGIKLFDNNSPHVRRFENSLASKLEIDYA